MSRKKLPNARASMTFEFKHTYPGANERTFTASVGFYPDGKVGEARVQLVNGQDKLVTVDAHDATTILSLALQYGADLKATGRSMLRDEDGKPHGFMGSLIDALVDMQVVR